MAKLEIPVKVYFGEIDEIIRELKQLQTYKLFEGAEEVLVDINDVARVLAKHVKATTAEPEIKPIEYRDCANAMLRMWMDNVVTDGEYNRIMDKLNAHWGRENG